MKTFSPNKYHSIKTCFAAMTILATILSSAQAFAFEQETTTQENNCYTISFGGRILNEETGTSTWSYTISRKDNCEGPSISHWDWVPCFSNENIGEKVVSFTPSGASVGFDGATGFYGVKWGSQTGTFSITIKGQPQIDAESAIGIIKAGQAGEDTYNNNNFSKLNIAGPSCTEPEPEPECGNNILETGEACDNGQANGVVCDAAYGQTCNYCSTTCQPVEQKGPFCGDNLKNGSEQCDGTDGVLAHYTCNDECKLEFLPFCGDGVVGVDEECDDGNITDNDGCSYECKTEAKCEEGQTQEDFNYISKPQHTFIDNSELNLEDKLCVGTCDLAGGISVDTSDGQPHYIYLTWDHFNPADYNGFLNFNLKLNHMENQSSIKVELKNQSGEWVEICDPAERASYSWDTCNLAPYALILKEAGQVDLRIVAIKDGACHEYLKCAKLEIDSYKCNVPEPFCGDGIKNQTSEECDGTDGVGANQSCSSDCKLVNLPYCGDGIKNGSEQCDGTDGVGLHQACTDECKLIDIPFCGNGIKEGEEECDGTDGVTDNYTCTDDCILQPVCTPVAEICGNQTDDDCDGKIDCADEDCSADASCTCKASGGTIGTTMCCLSTQDFRATCNEGIGACGCAPEASHEVKVCNCPEGMCFNGSTCSSVCDPNLELAKNGGFESPLIADSQSWNIFTTAQLNSWNVEWLFAIPPEFMGYFRPITPFLELQNDLTGWAPQQGNQFAELDTDWDGPTGTLNGEPASVRIFQDIPTIAGQKYTISFWFSPRPNTSLEENRLKFKWDGAVITDSITGAGENTTIWKNYTYTLTATTNNTRIEFSDLGLPDAEGTLLDNVSVKCGTHEPEPFCGDGIKNQTSEECDGTDGVGANQSCSSDCKIVNLPYCGDGIKNDAEQCDGTDGISAHYTCTAQCTLQYIPYCGDNLINQTSEQCDGTAGVGLNQACTSECMLINIPTCGNGVKEGQEECDGTDGVGAHYSCTSQCTLQYIPYCGDNLINQTSEQCDGTTGVGANQTCTAECTLITGPFCGDNIKNGTEQCDGTDGVGAHQSCTSECTLTNVPYCGDNIKNNNEQCDGTDGVGAHQSCSNTCTLITIPFCGDAICNNSETCSSCSSDCGGCGGGGGGGGGGNPYPALAISKTVAEIFVNPGGTLNYTVTLKNNGFMTAKNVVLTDTLPNGFTFKDTGLNVKVWNLGDIIYNATKVTTFQVIVGTTVAEGNYINSATAKADNQGAITALAPVMVLAGEVLGERTELPNTGVSPIWFVMAGLMLMFVSGFGLVLTRVNSKRIINLQSNN